MTAGGWEVAVVIGVLAGALATYDHLFRRGMPGTWVVGIIAGLIGAYLGGMYLGQWGWMRSGINVAGAIIGALILPHIIEFFGPELPSSTPQS
jgi:uncharacterized membrane protein YeaQ/YmgE (transglycosylase-associated protein family)